MASLPGADRVHIAPIACLCRGELFAGVCVLGFANGIVVQVGVAIAHQGFFGALMSTFDISALVWIAFYLCPALMLGAPREQPSRSDVIAATLAMLAFMLPVHWLSWMSLTGLALYILSDAYSVRAWRPINTLHRGAWVMLAITGAMFWGRILLIVGGDLVLQADAVLVSWLTWTPRLGNTLQAADGSGYVWIAPGCSSLANVSLAILCWVLFAQSRGLRWSVLNAAWCFLACFAVVCINVIRIGLVVLHGEYYEIVHGAFGATIAGWLTVVAIVAICNYGVRRGHLVQA